MEPLPSGRILRRSDGSPWRSQVNPTFNNISSASAAVSRGNLGMNFYGSGENLPAKRC